MRLLEIAVAAPLDQTLTYRLPAALAPTGADSLDELVGRRVLVPLGKRRVTGYVLAVEARQEVHFTVRDILELLDAAPLFHSGIIPLFRWIADYYHYPLGEVIRVALPGGLTPRSVNRLELTPEGGEYFQGEAAGAAPEWVLSLVRTGKLSPKATSKLLASKSARGEINRLIKQGLLALRESLTDDAVREKTEICFALACEVPGGGLGDPLDQQYMRGYREGLSDSTGLPLKLSEAKTLYYLQSLAAESGRAQVPRRELNRSYTGAAKAMDSLLGYGLVRQEERRVYRGPGGEQLAHYPPPSSLTPEQREVLAELLPAVRSREFQPFLLHGVTGSGKTEVYLQASAETLAMGRDVLVIVPEIALATQLEAHFVSRFGDQVVVLHSGLTSAEKFDQYHLALSGQAKIVIGARSAVFAPLADPGLIVVDEEHDGGLKQDDTLRYNGRDLAVVRAKQQAATVLLASATPSVVSYHNSLSGKYRLLTMTKRVGDRPLPRVTVIDLRKPAPGAKKGLFRPPLLAALERNLERGRQSVLLMNRRGFSTTVLCQECGTPVQCAHCNVSLTRHRARQKLLCHYCGYYVHEKTVCASCGSLQLVSVGLGSERVEEEVRTLFPQARIARLDTDTARDRTAFLKILGEMRDGAIDILVGTQMVAKGHHFPGVTVVGIVWADGGLSLPDYRAAEKTFQLITQVTGRAGRGEEPGEVFIQTMRPEHYAIVFARQHNYMALAERELELRRNPLFPPFVRMVTVHVQGGRESEVRETAQQVVAACKGACVGEGSGVEILGPAPAPIDRIKENYRWQVILKSTAPPALHRLCAMIRHQQKVLVRGACRIMLDVDPENML